MKTSDLLKMCLQNLRRRKFRTVLTVVGVVIGTAAIISMISLGIGINKSSDDFIRSWGDLTIINFYQQQEDAKITDETIAVLNAMPEVKIATPFVYYYSLNIDNLMLYAGNNNRYESYGQIIGVNLKALEEFDYKFSSGSLHTPVSSKKIPIVFGSRVAYNFSDTRKSGYENMIEYIQDPKTGEYPDPFFDPLTTDVLIKASTYSDSSENEKKLEFDSQVLGTIQSDNLNDWESQYSVFIDVADLNKISSDYAKMKGEKRKDTGYQEGKIKVHNLEDVAVVEETLADMNIGYYSLESMRQQALDEAKTMQIILGSLGGVSLLVAAISIANTMVMSVYERTREIGIMKVLGCFVKDIRTMFLFEAAMIGFLGGIIGIIVSYILSFLINTFGGALVGGGGMGMGMMGMGMGGEESAQLSIIPLWLVLLGLGFATAIGIAAGFYPASRAVKISALEAIKHE